MPRVQCPRCLSTWPVAKAPGVYHCSACAEALKDCGLIHKDATISINLAMQHNILCKALWDSEEPQKPKVDPADKFADNYCAFLEKREAERYRTT